MQSSFRNVKINKRMRDVTLPMTISVPILLLYMIICALVVQYYDETEDIRTGLDFKNSFYFAFISLSTIGLGDIMPNNLQVGKLGFIFSFP